MLIVRDQLRSLAFLVPCLALACAVPPTPDAPPLPASGRHRVSASGGTADALVAGGATLIADYGTFRVLDASPGALRGLGSAPEVEVRDDFLRIALGSGDIDTSRPALAAPSRAPAVGADGKALHLFQFAAPVRPEWLAQLEATGAKVVTYIPANAYLLYGDAAALDRAHGLALAAKEVQFDAPYLPAHKIDRTLAAAGVVSVAVQLVEDAGVNAATIALARSIARRPGSVSRALGYVNLVVHADRAAVDAIASRPDVVSIQPWVEPTLRDERQDVIVAGQLTGTQPIATSYLGWLASKGFTQEQFDASGFGVDVSDSGLDNGTTAPNHFGLYRLGAVGGASRVSYNRLEGTPHGGSTLQGCDGHGTINAHIIGGFSDRTGATFADAQGFRYGLGVAPFVKLGSSVVFDPNTFTSPDYEDLVSRAYRDGMRISSNSWGAGTSLYTSDCQRYDALVRDGQPAASAVPAAGNQQMVIVFAAGNAGSGAGTIGSPGNAKNVISAGASENVRAFGGADGCGLTDFGADAAFDVASFSSRGPAADGRTRPDILAPGTHVTGGVAQADGQRAEPPASASGQALACYVGSGVCGGVSSTFFPAGQQWYTASSGTSHSTPAIAGAAALVRQWFLNEGLPAPSPAMTKAFLMSAARYMTGVGAADTLYSNSQGMGLLDLGSAFDGTPRLLRDQELDDLFTATGQTRTFTSAVGDPTKPFRVTLAWTDAPGSTAGSAWKNDLDLTVDVGGTIYKGNHFTGAISTAGGIADNRNNVESVFLPAGTTGPFTVTVTAANINSDGVPANATPLDQDFALVITNGCAAAAPAPPAGVTAIATADNTITVSWTAGAAPTYHVYRATASGGPYAKVATVSAPPLVDTGRSGGATYFYVVRAQQDCAVSPPSAEASVTATGACLFTPAFAGLASASTTGELLCGNSLTWSAATAACGGTIAYDVHRSATSGFTPAPANRIASGVGATSYVDTGGLTGGTTYYYVVRAVETSAGGPIDDGNRVERAAAPYHLSSLLRDDFDLNRPPTPAAWWVERTLNGTDRLALVSGCRWQSPSSAYRFGDASTTCGGLYTDNTQNVLVLGGDGGVSPSVNGIDLPAGSGAKLTFRLWYAFESSFDGADLVYSTTGATGPYVAISDTVTPGSPAIVSGGYDGNFSGVGGTRRGWTGTNAPPNGGLKEVIANLDALGGQRVWLGWRVATDVSVVREGLYLDDVLLEVQDPACSSCAAPPPAAPTGVSAAPTADNQITVSWTANGADSYDVLRSQASGGPYAPVGNVAAPPFVDSLVSGGATYFYVVVARQSCAASPRSAEASATATGVCLLPPEFAGLASASPTGGNTCGNALAWVAASPSCGGTLSYDVFRSTTSGFAPDPANRIATGVTGTGHVDAGGLAPGTTYFYVVRAVETTSAPVPDANTVHRSAATPPLCSSTPAPPGPPVRFLVLGIPPSVQANAATSVTFIALDANGQVATGYPGPATLTSSDPAAVFPPSVTFSGGTATATVRFRTAGARSITVTDGADAAVQGLASTTVLAGPATGLAYSAQPSTTAAGSFFNPVVRVAVSDAFGNPVSGATVSLALGANPGGAALQGGTSAIAVGGVATFGTVYLTKAAAGYTLVASSTGLPPATSVAFDIIPGAPQNLAFVEQPSAATAGVPISPAPTVELRDAFGNVSTATALVTVALATTPPGGATLSGTTAVTTSGGIATFNDLRLDKAGTGYTLLATSSPLSSSQSVAFAVEAGPPTHVLVVQEPTVARAGVPLAPPVSAVLLDAFENLALSATTVTSVTFANNPTGANLTGPSTATPAGGTVTFSGLAIDRSGMGYRLEIGALGLTPADTATIDVFPGLAVRYGVAGPAMPAPEVQVTYDVNALDQNGDVVFDYAGVAAVSSTDPAAVFPPTIAFAGGHAPPVAVTFKTGGAQSLTFTGSGGGITGSTDVLVGGASPPPADGGGCGCGSGSAGSGAALLGLALLLGRTRPRRRA